MKLSNNTWFWILQVIGWGIPAVANNAGKLAIGALDNRYYAFSEMMMVFAFGVLSTIALRWYLKKNTALDQFRQKDVLRFLFAYVGASLLFASSLLLAEPLYEYFHGEPLNMSNLRLISNFLNAFAFVFLWLLIYIAIITIRRLRRNRIERLELEASLKESQLNTLKGQINPHFMFNSLNNIRGLMLEDVEKSREMITRLSEMLRYSLTKNNVDFIALKSELEMVDNYIALSKIQLEDRLVFTSEITPHLQEVEIPPMLIQMLIENAVKHGISKEKEGGLVRLCISEENKLLTIEIKNTGTLSTNGTSTKIGLKNIERRLALLYGNRASFSLSEENHEVIAALKLPL